MKIAIIGAGAVGLYYGARLQRVGADVRFLLRSDFGAVKQRGIRIRAPDGNFHLKDVVGVRQSSELGSVDLVIVALKATSNHELRDLLEPVVRGNTIILCLQNGLGVDWILRKWFPDNRIMVGLCFVCLNRTDPGVVENYHLGSLTIGELGEKITTESREIGNWFLKAGVKCRLVDDLRKAQWRKLVWNVPFNGLSIVGGGLTTDEIVLDEGLCQIARGLMEEVISAASALGMDLSEALIDKEIELTRSFGDYRTSSLVDFESGRPVEVEAIWGEPLRQAVEAGLDLPKLETLYRLLRVACEGRRLG